jgi:VWFA-related protein
MKSFVLIFIFTLFVISLNGVQAQIVEPTPPPIAQKEVEDDLIKIETNLVSVPVIVSDRQGRFVSGLKVKNFTLYQDGKKQKIDFFADEKEPINVALLLDTSISTGEVIEEIKTAALEFIKFLNKNDQAMIIGFDSDMRILSPLTSEQKILRNAIFEAKAAEGIGTIMRRTVENVVKQPFGDVPGRKAIILLTDGKDSPPVLLTGDKDFSSSISKENLFKTLEESDVLVYSIFYTTETTNRLFADPPKGVQRSERNRQYIELLKKNNAEATVFLNEMSELTAGRFYKTEVTNLKQTFRNIVDELRKMYRLGFYPPETTEKEISHEIKVEVNKKNVSVRSRKTYRLKTQNK